MRRFGGGLVSTNVRRSLAGLRFTTGGAPGSPPTPSTSQAPSDRLGSTSAAEALLSKQEIEKVAWLVESDPRILMEVIANLEPQTRRQLIIAGGAMEWFGKESAAVEIEKADADKDRVISPKDFDHWLENALKRRQEELRKRSAPAAAEAAAEGSTSASAGVAAEGQEHVAADASSQSKLPLSTLCFVALEAALPFVGFGFLDNATMILAGDAIDGTLGFYLNCSVLASAAMGNVCSGLLGMQVHGLIDKLVQKLNVGTPVLTEEQMRSRPVFFAGHIGGTLGIMVGLTLGMLPLLFIGGDNNEKSDYAMFQKWDLNESGYIEFREFEKVLKELGLKESHKKAQKLIDKYGENNRINFEQFSELKNDLREGRPIFD